MGSAIGLAVATSVLNAYLRTHLSPTLTPLELSLLLQNTQTLHSLSLDKQKLIRKVFAQGYNLQFRIATGVAGVQFLATALIWRRKNVVV
jgi:hypothetical protein